MKTREYVEDLLNMCVDCGFTASIITNGTTISEFLLMLSRFSLQISSVIITIDGNKATHNKLRHTNSGEGTFAKIMEGLNELERKNINYIVRVNVTNEILDMIAGDHLKLPEKNLAIYRVKHADSTDDAKLSRIMSLVLDGKIALENIALNHVVYFLSMMGEKHVYPLFHYCQHDKTYLFGVDGETLYSCTELMTPLFAAGSYYPTVSFTSHFAKNQLIVEDTCKLCPVFPVCGGSCAVYRDNAAGTTSCNYYIEIVEMIDVYIKRMFGNQQGAQQ